MNKVFPVKRTCTMFLNCIKTYQEFVKKQDGTKIEKNVSDGDESETNDGSTVVDSGSESIESSEESEEESDEAGGTNELGD